jgi:hypothetical protein
MFATAAFFAIAGLAWLAQRSNEKERVHVASFSDEVVRQSICFARQDLRIYYSLLASRAHFDVAKGVLSRFVEPDASRKQYLAQIDIAKRLFGRRNAMVHKIWDTRGSGAGILDFSQPPGSRSRSRPISKKEMEKLLAELEDCLNAIIDISISVGAWQPSHDKP